jgi:hypothetical protein
MERLFWSRLSRYGCFFLAGISTKTNKEIRDLIIQSSDKYAAPTAQYGYGILQLGFNPFGKGF